MISNPLRQLTERCETLERQNALLLGACKLLLDRLEREGTGARETSQAIDLARDAIRAVEPLDAEAVNPCPLNASKPSKPAGQSFIPSPTEYPERED